MRRPVESHEDHVFVKHRHTKYHQILDLVSTLDTVLSNAFRMGKRTSGQQFQRLLSMEEVGVPERHIHGPWVGLFTPSN